MIYFILGAIVYSLGAFVSNSAWLKTNPYYVYMGMGLGLVANYIWFSLAQKLTDNSKVLLYGFYWDLIIVLTFVLIPLLFFEVRLSPLKATGLGVMAVGFILTKI